VTTPAPVPSEEQWEAAREWTRVHVFSGDIFRVSELAALLATREAAARREGKLAGLCEARSICMYVDTKEYIEEAIRALEAEEVKP